MNRSIFFQCVLCAGFLVSLSMNSQAQRLTAPQLFPSCTRCDHVIQMMLRHGVNNSFDRSGTNSLLNRSPFGGIQVPVSELGDLQIVQVNQFPTEVPACGPKFAVVVMNQSHRQVCNFHVSAVAVFGHICPSSPNATVSVDKINPGEALEVIVALPIEAYSMGNRNGEALGFERLIVAIDSYDELLETDEANNIKAFNASEIAVVTTVIGHTAISVIESSESTSMTALPVQSSANLPVANSISSFGGNVNGDVSVDALDLDHPTPESLRSAIQQVNAPQSTQQVAPQQVAPQQVAPQQVAPQQVAPQQVAPQQVAPQQVAPQQVAPQQVAPQQVAP